MLKILSIVIASILDVTKYKNVNKWKRLGLFFLNIFLAYLGLMVLLAIVGFVISSFHS